MPAPWRDSLVIGNPENRRITMWQAAVEQSGRPTSHIVSYLSLLRGDVDLPAELLSTDLVRIESPGENSKVERELLLRGARCAERDIDTELVTAAVADHGRIVTRHSGRSATATCSTNSQPRQLATFAG